VLAARFLDILLSKRLKEPATEPKAFWSIFEVRIPFPLVVLYLED
jgi:hypothetical protein